MALNAWGNKSLHYHDASTRIKCRQFVFLFGIECPDTKLCSHLIVWGEEHLFDVNL